MNATTILRTLPLLPLAVGMTVAVGISANTYDAQKIGSGLTNTVNSPKPVNDGRDIPIPADCSRTPALTPEVVVVPTHYYAAPYRMTLREMGARAKDKNELNDVTTLGFCGEALVA